MKLIHHLHGTIPNQYHAGKEVQRSSPLPPGLHGENRLCHEEEKIIRGMHEGPNRI